jgi:hypothetical protein
MASREELALAAQLASTAMPPGCKVWHPQYGDGYVSQHYGTLSLGLGETTLLIGVRGVWFLLA